jgi:cellulose synthase/poly-beta-1,6-N-acetylglucosamine synthase-like glycosyltransferase
MDIPKIAVIVPAKGEAPYLDKCIDSILKLTYPYFDIIVVDDGLTENAKRRMERFRDQVTILSSSREGPSHCRNIGANFTDAKFLAFTDSDCYVDKDWLKELMRGFLVYPEAAGCGGTQKLPEEATKFEQRSFLFMRKVGFLTDYMRSAKSGKIIEVDHNASCNVMYKREIFLEAGGFLEGLWPGEDVELDYRLKRKGYDIAFNPQAVVYHHRPKNIKSLLSMMYRYGKAQGILVCRYGIFRKIQLTTFISVFFLLVLTVLAFLNVSIMLLVVLGAVILILLYFLDISLFALFVLAGIWWNYGFIMGLTKRHPLCLKRF